MRLAVVVQARTGSTRLPGKVLLPVAGAPLLQRMIERVRGAKTAFALVVAWETGANLSMSHRMTIDYPEDYAFVAAIYDSLWRERRPIFPLAEILELLERRPDVFALNAKYAGVNWYRNHLADLKTVRPEE